MGEEFCNYEAHDKNHCGLEGLTQMDTNWNGGSHGPRSLVDLRGLADKGRTFAILANEHGSRWAIPPCSLFNYGSYF